MVFDAVVVFTLDLDFLFKSIPAYCECEQKQRRQSPAKVVSMASIATLKISPENDLFAMNRQEPRTACHN